MKHKDFIIPTAILVLCTLIFGYTLTSNTKSKALIAWSERPLIWEDFEIVDEMDGDTVALIYSDISCPDLITDANSRVYAFMNPNRSARLRNEYDFDEVLVHEQYHFNLAEYCARLLRKDIVKLGLDGLNFKTMKSLKIKYSEKLDSLQTVYDDITDHSTEPQLQRYWELQIDDWLRQTAYYENEDVKSYYNFNKNRTQFFKTIHFTFTHNVLTSNPVGETDLAFGNTYEVEYLGPKEQLVKFYQNGKLTDGGYFQTAITRIVQKKKGFFEIHYYNLNEVCNTALDACIRKIEVDENKNKVERYYNGMGERVYRNAVYETKWTYDPRNDTYYASFFNEAGRKIANNEGVYHEKITLDEKNRIVGYENYDQRHQLKNDKNHIARYQLIYNDDHLKREYLLFDENGAFAFHLSDYHLAYEYDEKGLMRQITSLDHKGDTTYDHNGASIYVYTYDLFGRQTSEKRFNKEHHPIIANDDYFQKVINYDEQGRKIFEADYYPEYVLRFSDDKDGATRYSYENDSLVKIDNLDAYNNTTNNTKNTATTIQTLNSKKQVVKEVFLNSSGNFTQYDTGDPVYFYKYDDFGNKIESAAYDSIGNRKAFEADVAMIRWKYDSQGNKLKTTYYNTNGDLATAKDSATFNMYTYTPANFLYERTNFNMNMEPQEINGIFKSEIKVNKEGLDSLYLDYTTENRLIDGVAITKFFYNKYGNKTRTEYYGANNKRTKDSNGISAVNYVYNIRQLLTGYEYFDEKNKPTNNQHGVAKEKWILDDLGHTLTYEYWDKNNDPVIGEYGYHKITYEWDTIGETSKSSTYGIENELVEDENGTAVYNYQLAPSGLIQVVERFNKDNKLANNSRNVAISHYTPKLNGLYYLEKELNALGEVVKDTLTE